MKKRTLLTILLVLCITFQPFLPIYSVSLVTGQQKERETLTNSMIVELTKSGLPAEVIIEKINSSTVKFDLSAEDLQNLKTAGVADWVIVAMLRAARPATTENETIQQPKEVEISVPDGTEIEVQLKNNLSGQDAKEGDVVDLVVVRNVVVNDVVVIAEGAAATARITRAKRAGYWGKSGKLEWSMQDVQTVANRKVPVRFSKSVSGGSNSGSVAVGAVVTTVLLGPVGLLWGLKKGKKATIPAGSKFSVFTDKDSTVLVKPSPAKTGKL